jgi:hypothetical protein
MSKKMGRGVWLEWRDEKSKRGPVYIILRRLDKYIIVLEIMNYSFIFIYKYG